jgi:hypothetical protein
MALGRKTGGRQKGAVNRKTAEAAEKAAVIAQAIQAAVPGAFEGDAHAFLMSIYKNPEFDTDTRIDAAGKAIRFEKPVLSSVEAKVGISYDEMTEEQLNEIILRDGAAIGLLSSH